MALVPPERVIDMLAKHQFYHTLTKLSLVNYRLDRITLDQMKLGQMTLGQMMLGQMTLGQIM